MDCYPGQRAEGETTESLLEDISDSYQYSARNSETLRPHSTHATIEWLDQNYHLEDGICIPRSSIYEHYSDFCQRECIQPVNAASFGKIIRQQFPTVTTRRLGTRGQSKYHYYGLGIKPSSRYYTPDYVEKLNAGNSKKPQDTRKATYHEKPSAVLPPFPDVNSMTLSDKIPLDKLKTFMVMYRAHCQRILDSVVRANFTEVESFLLHFWQGMPSHMLPVLASDVVVDLVAHCDTLLYRVISNVLITSPLQNLPDSLAGEIRKFSDLLRQWMEVALKGLPESLQEAKYKVTEGFVNGLRRQTSLTKLAQVARGELRNSNCLEQLKQDWESLDMSVVYTQTLYAIDPLRVPVEYHQLLPQFLDQFDNLLNDHIDLEHFMLWAEDMVNATVVKAYRENHSPLKEACQAFILTWKFFTSKVLQEFTMENAPSFGFLILLHMLMDDYITHLLESKLEKEDEKVYSDRLQQMKKEKQTLGGYPPTTADGRMRSSSVTQSSSGSTPSPVENVTLPMPLTQPTPLSRLSTTTPPHETIEPMAMSISQPSIADLPSLTLPTLSSFALPEPTTSPVSSHSMTTPPANLRTSFTTSLISNTPSIDSIVPSPPTHLTNQQHLLDSLMPSQSSDLTGSVSMVVPKTSTTTDFNRSYHPPSSTNISVSQSSLQNYPLHSTPMNMANHTTRLQRHQSDQDVSMSGYQQQQSLQQIPTQMQSFYSHQSQQQQILRSNPVVSLSLTQTSTALAPSLQQGSSFGCLPTSSSYEISALHRNTRNTPGLPAADTQRLPLTNHQLPPANHGFSFSRSPTQQLMAQGQPLQQGGTALQNILPDLARGSGSVPLGRSNSAGTMVTPNIPNIPSFTTLNVPFASTSTPSNATTSSLSLPNSNNNLSLFPSMYPYTPFVVPTVPTAQMNTPFAPAGIQMPGATPGSMPGYSYIPGVTPSLYGTQVSSNSFTR